MHSTWHEMSNSSVLSAVRPWMCHRYPTTARTTTGDLFVIRGKWGDLLKILWHDGLGMSLYAKRLERGRFIWPTPVDGAVAITAAEVDATVEQQTTPVRSTTRGKPMRGPLNDCIATTRRCRCWPRARRRPVDYGPICAMIDPSGDRTRRRRCSSIRRIARRHIGFANRRNGSGQVTGMGNAAKSTQPQM